MESYQRLHHQNQQCSQQPRFWKSVDFSPRYDKIGRKGSKTHRKGRLSSFLPQMPQES